MLVNRVGFEDGLCFWGGSMVVGPDAQIVSRAPLLDEAADEYADRLTVAKLNIDENPVTPPKYGIRSIPTLMLFKDGAVHAQKIGAMSKSQLAEFLETNL